MTIRTLTAVVLLAGCSATTPTASVPTQPPVPAHCVARTVGHQVLPDPACTPGLVSTLVAQGNIHSTICVKGWTSTIRPPVTWSEPLKRRLMTAYGHPRADSLRTVELDHLIPLELGGDPTAVANLWPEPGANPNVKDAVESAARAAVCRKVNPLPLADTQAAMARDWVALGRALGVKVA